MYTSDMYIVPCVITITIFILQFLKNDILGYFKRWRLSVMNRPGFSAAEKKRMMLSEETLSGITLTSKYII